MLFVTIIYVVVHSNLVYGFENGFGDSFSFLSLSLSLSLCIDDASCKSLFWSLCVFSGIHEVS
jgi:hypothetical protein